MLTYRVLWHVVYVTLTCRVPSRSMGIALRRFLPLTQERVDIVGLLDEWAGRFFEELDYVREGNNATRFAEEMRQDLPQVCEPLSVLRRLVWQMRC